MGLINTTTKLSYARNELIKTGVSFIFDKVGDMIYYATPILDKANTFGAFSGATAGSGIPLTSSSTGALKVFADDNDTDIGSGTLARAIWGRNLVTAGSQNAELAGVQGSVVISTGEIIHNAGAVWGSLEARGSSSLNGTAGQNIFAAVMGRVGVGSSATFNIKTGAVCAGLAAMSNINTGSSTTQTGVTAGLYVGQWPSTDNWDYGIYIADAVTTGICIDADDCAIVLGDGQDASISWDTTHTQDVLAIGVGASRALVLMDKADVGSGGTTDVLDFTTLSNPGILFMTATPVASTYAFIRTYNIGADMHFVMKGSGDYTALILQPEDDSNNDTFFQWRCHEGAYPFLWENFTRGVVRSYNASPYTVLAMKDYETTLAAVKTGTGEDPVVTPCLILGDNNSGSHCIGIQFNDDGSGQRRLKIFDEAGNNVYIDPTSTTIEAS